MRHLQSRFLRAKFSTLIVADPNKPSADINALLTAAIQLKQKTDILQLGKNIQTLSDFYKNNAKNEFINSIFLAEHSNFDAYEYETSSAFISSFLSKNKYKNVLMGNSTMAKEILPRLSAQYLTQAVTDVISIESPEVFKRPIYAGNAIATVSTNADVKFIGIRLTNFDKTTNDNAFANESKLKTLKCEDYLQLDFKKLIEIVETKIQKSERPELVKAKVIISGGRALKSAENFEMLYKLSEKFPNCAIGASRAAVDAGYVPNDLQIGQTGKIVAPDLYIAIGISGAIQHVAGMKDSKVIVAINNNEDAPIFQVANYGLVGDLFKIIPELTSKL